MLWQQRFPTKALHLEVVDFDVKRRFINYEVCPDLEHFPVVATPHVCNAILKYFSSAIEVGSAAIFGPFGRSSVASGKRREPVALRPRLSPGLPLSDVISLYALGHESRQFAIVAKLNLVRVRALRIQNYASAKQRTGQREKPVWRRRWLINNSRMASAVVTRGAQYQGRLHVEIVAWNVEHSRSTVRFPASS